MSIRRYLFAATWLIISAHLLGVALSAAELCGGPVHMHGGVPAPDCPMHHQAAAPQQHGTHHQHHGAPASTPDDPGTPRLTCHCTGNALMLFFGETAVLPFQSYSSPVDSPIALAMTGAPQAISLRSVPPSPPPR